MIQSISTVAALTIGAFLGCPGHGDAAGMNTCAQSQHFLCLSCLSYSVPLSSTLNPATPMCCPCVYVGLRAIYGAGRHSHTMVGWRAAQHYALVRFSPNASKYNRAIREQPLSVLAGSDFPDFGYAADDLPLPGLTHDAGEAAHWPPFHAAAAQYIRSRPDFYDSEWSPATQKVVAFTFGTAVHYITDETWEGLTAQLGRGQGMVRTVSSLNLGHPGQSDDDEGPANMAADFGVSFLMNETGIEPWRREYPMEDIVEIYKLVPQLNPPKGTHGLNYSNVTLVALEECKVIFDLGLWAEKAFGQILFEAEYAKQVPLMAERMLDLPVGGIDDMAIWTGWVWERIARWLDSGPPAKPLPRYADAAGATVTSEAAVPTP